jgi:hypothetical protein
MSNRLDAMMNQYKNSTSSKKSGSNKGFDLKNYFATFLKDGIESATKRIRILPTADESSPFVEIHGHKTQVDGKWRTFVCAKHEKGEKCPFCEARELLLAQGDDAAKKEAVKFSAKKMYVVKVIDRDNPEDGVKFWRFNHDYRNTGTLDKIMGVLQTVQQDITDAKTGRDLVISINRDAKKRPVISSINQSDPLPLSDDEEQASAWLADERTWNDVYAIKSYDYLEIIVRGGIPTWQKDSSGEGGKFVDKASQTEAPKESTDGVDSELSVGVAKDNATKTPEAPVAATPEAASAPAPDAEDDDLPF